eukprot:491362_1
MSYWKCNGCHLRNSSNTQRCQACFLTKENTFEQLESHLPSTSIQQNDKNTDKSPTTVFLSPLPTLPSISTKSLKKGITYQSEIELQLSESNRQKLVQYGPQYASIYAGSASIPVASLFKKIDEATLKQMSDISFFENKAEIIDSQINDMKGTLNNLFNHRSGWNYHYQNYGKTHHLHKYSLLQLKNMIDNMDKQYAELYNKYSKLKDTKNDILKQTVICMDRMGMANPLAMLNDFIRTKNAKITNLMAPDEYSSYHQTTLLVHAFVRNNCEIKFIPNEIINLCIKWFYIEPLKLTTYKQAVDILLNQECCFGLYDQKIKQWRTAIFIKKWDNKKRLMIRFPKEPLEKINNEYADKFCTIKDFPVRYIMRNSELFEISKRDLRDMSNVPIENIDIWCKHIKLSKNTAHNY